MTSVESRFVERAGVSIHYLDCRPASDDGSVPIVFVPGLTDVADDYVQIAAATGRRTIVIDPRGHGRSDAPPHGYVLDEQASDIDAVVTEVAVDDIHLMTFSRGTCAALLWCEHPSVRIRSLTIGDYPAREIAIDASIAETIVASTWRGTPVGDRIAPHAVLGTCEESRDRSLWHVITSLGVPTTVVRSSSDLPLTDDDWNRYAALGPTVTRVCYNDSPHDIFRPDRRRFPRLAAANASAADCLIENGER